MASHRRWRPRSWIAWFDRGTKAAVDGALPQRLEQQGLLPARQRLTTTSPAIASTASRPRAPSTPPADGKAAFAQPGEVSILFPCIDATPSRAQYPYPPNFPIPCSAMRHPFARTTSFPPNSSFPCPRCHTFARAQHPPAKFSGSIPLCAMRPPSRTQYPSRRLLQFHSHVRDATPSRAHNILPAEFSISVPLHGMRHPSRVQYPSRRARHS